MANHFALQSFITSPRFKYIMNKSFGHENPFFSQPTFEVTIDVWENQRFKPLQGGWLGPYSSETMPFYSDVHGEVSIPHDKATNAPIITLPLGWQWCNENWKVDTSHTYGLTDSDGWSYASTFESLIECSIKRKLEGEVGRLSIVRRRRLIRKMSSVTADAKKDFEIRLNWAKDIRKKLEKVISQKASDYTLISEYEFKRKATFDRILFSAEKQLADTAQMLEGITEKLQLMKQFLLERGAIEREYSKKIGTLASKWMYAGQESTGAVVVKRNPGFFFTVSSASVEVANRLNEFSGMLSESLPSDVDSVIREIQTVRSGSQKEGPTLRNILRSQEEMLSKALSNYRMILEQSQGKDETKRVESLECLYSIPAANCLAIDFSTGGDTASFPGSNAKSSAFSVTFSSAATGSGAAGNNSNQAIILSIGKGNLLTDVWLAVQRYKQSVLEADSALFIFNAFTVQLKREAVLSSSRVSALLHSLIKVFASEQCRVWADASLMLRQLSPQRQGGRRTSVNNGESSQIVQQGIVLSVNTKDAIQQSKDGNSVQVVGNTTTELSPDNGNVEEEMNEDEPNEDTDDEIPDALVPGAPLLPILPDCSPACNIGQVEFLQISKQALSDLTKASASTLQSSFHPGFIARSASTSSIGGKEEMIWRPATAIITFDWHLHLYKPQELTSSSMSNNIIWIADDPLVSIDLSGVEVEPLLFSILGVKNAIEIRPQLHSATNNSKKAAAAASKSTPLTTMSILLSISSDVLNAATEDTLQEWLRLMANPLSNPTLASPNESTATQMSAVDIQKQKNSLLASFVQPAPSIEGIEI